jgi:hypothetical protein
VRKHQPIVGCQADDVHDKKRDLVSRTQREKKRDLRSHTPGAATEPCHCIDDGEQCGESGMSAQKEIAA